MKKLESLSLNQGVQIAYQSDVQKIEKINEGYKISTLENGIDVYEFTAKTLINAAGLECDTIASHLGINKKEYQLNYCKGTYFRIAPPKNKKINSLIYPTPFKGLTGLGIHTTIELDGGVKIGPNIEFLSERSYDYQVMAKNRDDFYQAASKYLPFLTPADLIPEMAGIRPKLQHKGGRIRDFIIQNEKVSGFPGLINLIGIESPGLTSSLAIAEYVSKIMDK